MSTTTSMSSDTRSKSWIATLKTDDYDQDAVEKALSKYTYVGQLEQGSSGYMHWQVYIENPTQIRFSTLKKKFPTGHFEPRRGSKRQAFDYVQKSSTSMGVTIQNGTIDVDDKPAAKSSIDVIRDAILLEGRSARDILLSDAAAHRHVQYAKELQQARDLALDADKYRDVKAVYLWGASGTGKSRALFSRYGSKAYRISSYKAPWDYYNGEKVVVMDEFYSTAVDHGFMLNLLDGYPLRLPARYADKIAGYDRIYVVSNVPLHRQYEALHDKSPAQKDALYRRFHYELRMNRDGTLFNERTGETLVDLP